MLGVTVDSHRLQPLLHEIFALHELPFGRITSLPVVAQPEISAADRFLPQHLPQPVLQWRGLLEIEFFMDQVAAGLSNSRRSRGHSVLAALARARYGPGTALFEAMATLPLERLKRQCDRFVKFSRLADDKKTAARRAFKNNLLQKQLDQDTAFFAGHPEDISEIPVLDLADKARISKTAADYARALSDLPSAAISIQLYNLAEHVLAHAVGAENVGVLLLQCFR